MRDPQGGIDCERVTASMEDYLEGRLEPGESGAIRRHVHACAGCFERVIGRDPVQLFAPLAEDSPGSDRPAFWEDFWPGIRDASDMGTAGKITWLRVAAAILAVAGAAAILALVPALIEQDGSEPDLKPPEVVAEAEPLPPTVERVLTPDSGDVQIYSMTYHQDPLPGSVEPEITELILIVDGGLDL